ncbi:unnamed protein product [Mucor hiemalis]
MSYSSYNAYIVQNNTFVILGIVVANYLLASIFPFSELLHWTWFQIPELVLLVACFYNICSVFKDSLRDLFKSCVAYLPAPGSIAPTDSNICDSTNTEITNSTTEIDPLSLFYGSATTGICNNTSNPPDLFKCTTTASLSSSFWSSTTTRNQLSGQKQKQFEYINNIIDPRVASSVNLTAQSTSPSNFISGRPIPTLKYTPCIKPSFQPSTYRSRLLWILQHTPAVVQDFKITQILNFRKLWRSFSYQHSRIQYDKLTNALLENIFIPLANCLETNQECVFTNSEVLKFVTLNGHSGTKSIAYVMERIKELAANNKMKAFCFTPKMNGMPTDTDIIMHVFTTFLKLKEPFAVPPLVPVQFDVFKFLLIYVNMTPELEHWKVFEN